MSVEVKRTERGWVGHFILGDKCKFHRNTLLECGNKKWVVSTVGACMIDGRIETIGANRWYETMAFEAKCVDGYWEADCEKEIPFDSECGLYAESWSELNEKYPCVDNVANAMHERVVDELSKKIVRATRPYLTIGDLQKYPKDTRIYVGGYDKDWHWYDFAFMIDDGCLDEDSTIYFESIPPQDYINNRSDK